MAAWWLDFYGKNDPRKSKAKTDISLMTQPWTSHFVNILLHRSALFSVGAGVEGGLHKDLNNEVIEGCIPLRLGTYFP